MFLLLAPLPPRRPPIWKMVTSHGGLSSPDGDVRSHAAATAAHPPPIMATFLTPSATLIAPYGRGGEFRDADHRCHSRDRRTSRRGLLLATTLVAPTPGAEG